jgi:hypothetical protein
MVVVMADVFWPSWRQSGGGGGGFEVVMFVR